MVRFFSFLLVFLLFAGCLPEKQKNQPVQIKEYIIGGQKFYIPDLYTNFKHTSAGGESGFIQMWYPGDAPVPGDPGDLFDRGEWYKNVRLLFTFYRTPNQIKVMSSHIDTHKAYKKMPSLYGLEHFTQEDENRGNNDDFYIVDREAGNYINCSKKTDPEDSVQICSQRLAIENFALKITYNKKLLPEWKAIQGNVLALYESFSNLETAQAYLTKFNPQGE